MKGMRLSVSEVAPVLGVTEMQLRKMLRQKSVPFGKAVKTSDKPLRFQYFIFREPLLDFMGLTEWPGGGAK